MLLCSGPRASQRASAALQACSCQAPRARRARQLLLPLLLHLLLPLLLLLLLRLLLMLLLLLLLLLLLPPLLHHSVCCVSACTFVLVKQAN
jgi:hypothetical protein